MAHGGASCAVGERMGRRGHGITQVIASLYKEGWTTRDIAEFIYGDTSAEVQRRVAAFVSYARKKGLVNGYRRKRKKRDDGGDDRPLRLNVWGDHHWVRAPFEMPGSTGPRSYGFLSDAEKRRLKISAVVGDIAGSAGIKEYGTMYLMAQELCAYLAGKYEVEDAAAVGCVLTAVLALAPKNKELINRVLEWLEVF